MIQAGLVSVPRWVRTVGPAQIPAGAPGRAGGEQQRPAGRRIRGARAAVVPMVRAAVVLMVAGRALVPAARAVGVRPVLARCLIARV